jgi:regulator of protease activity HflC (stomatin/prohibitin superfamily)
MSNPFVEKEAVSANGLPIVFIVLGALALGAFAVWGSFGPQGIHLTKMGLGVAMIAAGLFVFGGVYTNDPNECALFLLFGDYRGADRAPGLRWANPLYSVRKANLKTQTLISPALKVNDERGNPIEIAAAVVWHIRDAAAAMFGFDDLRVFLATTVESTLREIASSHPYDDEPSRDAHDGRGQDPNAPQTKTISLRAHPHEIATALAAALRKRMGDAGGAIAIVDAKLTHLAYAPEIAGAMLRRQQAEAVLSARSKIVAGAVDMVDQALKSLEQKGIQLDDERRAAMVGNLLVVLCSDRDATPVINAGGLYNG